MLDNSAVLELRASRLAARKSRDAAILQRLIAGVTGSCRTSPTRAAARSASARPTES